MVSIPTKQLVRKHFDQIARDHDPADPQTFYSRNIKAFIRQQVRPNSRVLDVGCGTGDFLAAAQPSRGVGVDISPGMIKRAKEACPKYDFYNTAIEDFDLDEKFDYVLLVDVLDHVYDVMAVFESVYRKCHPMTKIILITINPWWSWMLTVLGRMGFRLPQGPRNYLEPRHINKIISLLNFSVSYTGYLLLSPFNIPVLSFLANSIGVRLWGVNKASMIQYMIMSPVIENTTDLGMGVSVVIPCHNEEDNIEEAVRRVPKMGKGTEIIVVNDGSTDETAERARALQKEFPGLKLIDYSPNRGKGHAVHQGFKLASREILMILDADISVPPEELPRFFDPLNKGLCQFVNGSRLMYPMEGQAMRTLNFFGNKVFGLIMTFIAGQELSDTLCGTKAFYRKDYPYFEKGMDRWGDFDLLFSALKIGNKIAEIPVHYKERKSGESKMKSLRHGLHLLKACGKGFMKIIFTKE